MLAMLIVMLLPLAGLLFFFVLPFRAALLAYLAGCVVSFFAHRLMHRAARLPVLTGKEGLIGRTARVVDWQGHRGTVRCHDELWTATSDQHLAAGDPAVIVAVHGLTIAVRAPTRDDRKAPEGVRREIEAAHGHPH